MVTVTSHEIIDRLNTLLRGELAAMESYRQAAEDSETDERIPALRALEEEHREAAEALRQQIATLGGAALDQDAPASSELSLNEVEEESISNYEAILQDAELDPETRALLQHHLLPKARAHVPIVREHLN